MKNVFHNSKISYLKKQTDKLYLDIILAKPHYTQYKIHSYRILYCCIKEHNHCSSLMLIYTLVFFLSETQIISKYGAMVARFIHLLVI